MLSGHEMNQNIPKCCTMAGDGGTSCSASKAQVSKYIQQQQNYKKEVLAS